MTPAAKPRIMACVRLGISCLKRYTIAEPAVVARKMRAKPMRVRVSMVEN
jgi:hypothetical protein